MSIIGCEILFNFVVAQVFHFNICIADTEHWGLLWLEPHFSQPAARFSCLVQAALPRLEPNKPLMP
jgi:hypothetical protein